MIHFGLRSILNYSFLWNSISCLNQFFICWAHANRRKWKPICAIWKCTRDQNNSVATFGRKTLLWKNKNNGKLTWIKNKWIFIFKAYWFIDAHNYVKNSVVRHCWSYYWFVLVGILNDLASEANIDTSQLSGQSNKTKQKNLQNLILKPCYFYFIILGFTQGKSFSLRTWK